jgi:hypothetical protein
MQSSKLSAGSLTAAAEARPDVAFVGAAADGKGEQYFPPASAMLPLAAPCRLQPANAIAAIAAVLTRHVNVLRTALLLRLPQRQSAFAASRTRNRANGCGATRNAAGHAGAQMAL